MRNIFDDDEDVTFVKKTNGPNDDEEDDGAPLFETGTNGVRG